MPRTNIVVRDFGRDGSAYAIVGQVTRALKSGGRADLVAVFLAEVMAGDYDHMLMTCLDYVRVELVDEEGVWENLL